jgi:hypothetical protein
MKKSDLILLFMILVLLTSCRWVSMKVAGIRAPQIESKESIYSFLLQIQQDTLDVFTLDTTIFEKLRREPFKSGWKEGFRPLQIRMYDKNGDVVLQWASCEGYLKDLRTFDTVPPRNLNDLNKKLKLQDDLNQYFTLDGNPAHIFAPPGYDYYILIYFAKWFYKPSKEAFLEVERYIQLHRDLKFKVYKIDTDFQKFWGIEYSARID